jgi:hypothetical protein
VRDIQAQKRAHREAKAQAKAKRLQEEGQLF